MKRDVLYVSTAHKRARVLKHLIGCARTNIILQMYLFAASGELRTLRPVPGFPWAKTVADWLIAKKRRHPAVEIIVVLDTQTIEDASRTHKRHAPLTRHRLESAGIIVLNASLAKTAFNRKRTFPQGSRLHETWENPSVRLKKSEWAARQNLWQILHNVEDHRKNLVIDSGRAGIVFSHNIIDQAFLWQENTMLLRGSPAQCLYSTAMEAVNDALRLPVQFEPAEEALKTRTWEAPARSGAESAGTTRLLNTGPEIQKAILSELNAAEANGIKDVRVASAYFSDSVTLDALIRTGTLIRTDNGAKVRILIDNCHALSLPPALRIFLRSTVNLYCIHACRKTRAVELRVFKSKPAEMMHLKAVAFTGKAPCLIAGQANFTPNSFSGAWLETSVRTEDPGALREFVKHYESLWERAEPVVRYEDMNLPARALARIHAFWFLALLRIIGFFGFQY